MPSQEKKYRLYPKARQKLKEVKQKLDALDKELANDEVQKAQYHFQVAQDKWARFLSARSDFDPEHPEIIAVKIRLQKAKDSVTKQLKSSAWGRAHEQESNRKKLYPNAKKVLDKINENLNNATHALQDREVQKAQHYLSSAQKDWLKFLGAKGNFNPAAPEVRTLAGKLTQIRKAVTILANEQGKGLERKRP